MGDQVVDVFNLSKDKTLDDITPQDYTVEKKGYQANVQSYGYENVGWKKCQDHQSHLEGLETEERVEIIYPPTGRIHP